MLDTAWYLSGRIARRVRVCRRQAVRSQHACHDGGTQEGQASSSRVGAGLQGCECREPHHRRWSAASRRA